MLVSIVIIAPPGLGRPGRSGPPGGGGPGASRRSPPGALPAATGARGSFMLAGGSGVGGKRDNQVVRRIARIVDQPDT